MKAQSKKEFESFSPDELSELYRDDPDQFRALADEALDQACIGHSPQQSMRLRQMQWRIDGQLRKGKTPLDRMRIMENIFYTEVFGDDGELAQLMYHCGRLLKAVRGNEEDRKKKPSLYLVKRGSET